MEPHLEPQRTWSGVFAMWGLALVPLAVLWAVGNPLLAAGVVALVVGAYVMGRVGSEVVRRLRARAATSTRGEAAHEQSVAPKYGSEHR